eukprot:g234.t1
MPLSKAEIHDTCEELHVSVEHVETLQRAFRIWDKNGDGDISSKELGEIMRSMGKNPTDEECDDMITEIDFDGDCDGTVSFSEFAAMMVGRMRDQDHETQVREAFEDICQGESSISPEAVKTAMASMGRPISDDEAMGMIREISTSGQVTRKEFQAGLKVGVGPWPLADIAPDA